ncbi:hypothetical protein LCGC14_1384590 [marine sediment metagenome]|uniref:Glycosyltransferase 2-like domain-containing protein n=1 Tax=marine sediment metagenome TaxID=412755 RepID=A0A0F9K1P9_9ZZZZ
MDNNKFCIIVPVYNSSDWIKKCIDSIKIQTYQKYGAIIVNDCSTDKTADIIKKEIKGFDKFKFIDNTKKSCALENTVKGIRYICKNDEDIIVILDGDDWLASKDVLKYVNTAYQKNIWVTWGQFKLATTNKICKLNGYNWCVPIKKDFNRRTMARYVFSHLRTYKYFLFKAIREEDLRDKNGNYYTTSGDVVVSLPLIELAGHKHRKCLDKVLYCYNDTNQLSDMKRCPELQKEIYHELKFEKNKYEPYTKVKTKINKPTPVDILIWTKDRPCQVDLLLRSIKYGFNKNCGNVFVRYDYTNEEFKKGYDKVVQKNYGIPISYIETTGDLEFDTKDIVNNKIKTKYMLAICDDDVFIRPVDVEGMLDLYNKDIAGVSLRMSTDIIYCYGTQKSCDLPKFEPCENNLLKWKWADSDPSTDWGYPAAVNNTIYKTQWYRDTIKDFKFQTPNTLEFLFNTNRHLFAPYLISLKKTRILNIPVNQVQTECPTNPFGKTFAYTRKELNDKWLNGEIIDTKNIYGVGHRGVNEELPYRFIEEGGIR